MDITIKNKVLRAKSQGMTNREISRAFKVAVGSVSNIFTYVVKPIYIDSDPVILDLCSMMGGKYTAFGFPDLHIPDQHPKALEIALKAHAYLKPDVTIIGNDFVQCTPFQRHSVQNMKDSSRFAEDFYTSTIKPANDIIDMIQKNTKLTVFQQGNHDAWIERWASSNGGTEKSVYSMVSLERNLAANRADFVWMPEYGIPIRLHEDLLCVHGWYYNIHAAHKHIQKSKNKNIIFNHTHRRQVDTISDHWSARAYEAMSAGCLCKRLPVYGLGGTPTEWVHGFWLAYIGKKSSSRYPVLIDDDRAILPCGKEIS